jgi:prepilin-type N-terminal cleavage/methylation domain-containing protein
LRSRGFTLLEVLVALAVVSVGVVVLARMQILSIRGTGYNRETTAAVALAQKTVESCRAAVFGTKPVGCGEKEGGMIVSCEMDVSGNAPYRSNNIAVKVTWGALQNEIVLSAAVAEK